MSATSPTSADVAAPSAAAAAEDASPTDASLEDALKEDAPKADAGSKQPGGVGHLAVYLVNPIALPQAREELVARGSTVGMAAKASGAKASPTLMVDIPVHTAPPPLPVESPPPPPKLLSFAAPIKVPMHDDYQDKPRTVPFCLQDSFGSRTYGCAMTVLQEVDGGGGDYVLWGVTMLSVWPLVDVFKCLLHSLFACRKMFGIGPGVEGDGEPKDNFGLFVKRARAQLEMLSSELRYVVEHPLWCGTATLPLCRALRWDPEKLSFLILCLLFDQRVLLHSARRELLYPCVIALNSLIAPLKVAGIFIPYLPAGLMSEEEVDLLINEATQPSLIGAKSSLITRLPKLSQELISANLDQGTVRHPAMLAGRFQRDDLRKLWPVKRLCAQLAVTMKDQGSHFSETTVRSACLGFVMTLSNAFEGGFVAPGLSTQRDVRLAQMLRHMGEFSVDISQRFNRRAEPGPSEELLRASRAAEASMLPTLAKNFMADAADDADVAPLLQQVWESMPFNVWWQERKDTGVTNHLLHHHTSIDALKDCVREQMRSLEAIESRVQVKLQKTFAAMANYVVPQTLESFLGDLAPPTPATPSESAPAFAPAPRATDTAAPAGGAGEPAEVIREEDNDDAAQSSEEEPATTSAPIRASDDKEERPRLQDGVLVGEKAAFDLPIAQASECPSESLASSPRIPPA